MAATASTQVNQEEDGRCVGGCHVDEAGENQAQRNGRDSLRWAEVARVILNLIPIEPLEFS